MTMVLILKWDEKMIFQTLCPPKPFDEDETDFPNSFSLFMVVSVKPTIPVVVFVFDIFKPNIFVYVFDGQNTICSPLLLSFVSLYPSSPPSIQVD